ncbi:glycosyltransferase family 2 protein, partial [Rhizobium leguminosarum]
SILKSEPSFVVRLALEKCLRLRQHCLRLVTATANGRDPPRVNRSKFDQQIIPSSVERPDETAQSRRHLMQLTEVDAELSSALEPVADRLGQVAKSQTRSS